MTHYTDINSKLIGLVEQIAEKWDNMTSTQKVFIESQTNNLMKWISKIEVK